MNRADGTSNRHGDADFSPRQRPDACGRSCPRGQVLRLAGQVAGAGAPGAPVVLVDAAVVFAAHQDPVQPGTTLLTLVVPADVAPNVAAAGATGAAAVVKVPSS